MKLRSDLGVIEGRRGGEVDSIPSEVVMIKLRIWEIKNIIKSLLKFFFGFERSKTNIQTNKQRNKQTQKSVFGTFENIMKSSVQPILLHTYKFYV